MLSSIDICKLSAKCNVCGKELSVEFAIKTDKNGYLGPVNREYPIGWSDGICPDNWLSIFESDSSDDEMSWHVCEKCTKDILIMMKH